jgi:hypothetical protein
MHRVVVLKSTATFRPIGLGGTWTCAVAHDPGVASGA